MANNQDSSQKSILKSTGLVGLGQIVTIVVGLIKTKFVAILLGPAGVGIMGFYQNIIDLVRNLSGFGINFSGVKDVAQAVSTGNTQKISRISKILFQLSLWTGILGMSIMLLFHEQISQYTFGSTDEKNNIVFLSVCVLFASVSSAQLAFLQGMRELSLMTKSTVASVGITLFTSIPLFYWLGREGIVPSIILSAFASLSVTFFFARKIKLQRVQVSLKEAIHEGGAMIRLGFFTVIASLLGMGAMYWIRSYIMKWQGLDDVGYFNAAWSIGSMYLMLVLNAMSTDYFPKLSGVISEHKKARLLINNQAEIALLIGGAVIIGFLAYEDLAINILYSKKFEETKNILKWILVGDFFKLLSWPIGFIILAKGRGKSYLYLELLWNAVFVSVSLLLMPVIGVKASGMAYCIGNLLNFVLVFFLINRLILFRFNRKVLALGFIYFSGILFILAIDQYINSSLAKYVLATLVFLFISLFSLKRLNRYLNFRNVLSRFKKQ